MDTEQLSETLTKLNNGLDPKSIGKKSNSEILLQLEVHRSFYRHSLQIQNQILQVSTHMFPDIHLCEVLLHKHLHHVSQVEYRENQK